MWEVIPIGETHKERCKSKFLLEKIRDAVMKVDFQPAVDEHTQHLQGYEERHGEGSLVDAPLSSELIDLFNNSKLRTPQVKLEELRARYRKFLKPYKESIVDGIAKRELREYTVWKTLYDAVYNAISPEQWISLFRCIQKAHYNMPGGKWGTFSNFYIRVYQKGAYFDWHDHESARRVNTNRQVVIPLDSKELFKVRKLVHGKEKYEERIPAASIGDIISFDVLQEHYVQEMLSPRAIFLFQVPRRGDGWSMKENPTELYRLMESAVRQEQLPLGTTTG